MSAWKLLRRKQLDRQLLPLRELLPTVTPKGGWIKTIREALGMSQQVLANRLDIASASTINHLETAEQRQSITVKRLRAAANALDCDLFVLVVPRNGLESMVEAQARSKAMTIVNRVAHTMALEQQNVPSPELKELVEERTRHLVEEGGATLWE